MALLNIVRGRRVQMQSHCLSFRYADMPSAGFSFDCDASGAVDESALSPAALANLGHCRAGHINGEKIIGDGVRLNQWSYWEEGRGTCVCGRTVELAGDERGRGIDCDCGRVYNGCGQELAPRSQWDVDPSAEYEAELSERGEVC